MAQATGDLQKRIKYALDRAFGLVLLIGTAPLLLVVALAIRLDSRGNPLFLQERVGEHSRSFTILKFRTMVAGSENDGLGITTAADDSRITRLGRMLRATGLDELPQLVNVVRGEMSFIGPRPTLRYQVDGYTPYQARRLLFRPGITGWAQVHGRNNLSWDDRIKFDVHYVEHHSLWLDLKCLWRTAVVLLGRQGVYASGRANDDFAATQSGSRIQPNLATHGGRKPASSIAAPDPSVNFRDGVVVGGAGGHASVVIDAIRAQGCFTIAGIIDDSTDAADATVLSHPVLGSRRVLHTINAPRRAVVAIGSPRNREELMAFFESLGFELPVVTHPSAQVGSDVIIRAGTVLLAGTIVNARAKIGKGVIVNTGASIDHDCVLGDFCHVAPGARLAGNVRVGDRTHIGIGASVVQNVEIGDDVVVGAGAAVVRSVASGTTVVGVPARPIRHLQSARSG